MEYIKYIQDEEHYNKVIEKAANKVSKPHEECTAWCKQWVLLSEKELDAFERSFDEAFIEMVSQEYYLRVFQDVFDETAPVRLDKIARAFPR